MLVSKILGSKSVKDVVTVKPDTSVAEAVGILSARRIGALIVSSDGVTPLGILSERDVVRELGNSGPSVMEQKVSALMTARLVGCGKGDEAESVLSKMTEGRFRHMPVMEGDRMVGLISIGDVVKARLGELAMERDALEGMIMGN